MKSLNSGVKSRYAPFIVLPLALLAAALWAMTSGAASASSADDYYFPWYDNNASWGMNGDWLLICNRGSGNAEVKIEIGGAEVARFDASHGNAIAPGGHVEWQYPGTLTSGPVKVTSISGEPLGVSQRVLYKNSFNEINAIKGTDLEYDYLFTWYDNNPAGGMNGNWICITNLDSQPTEVQIFVGDISDNHQLDTLGPILPGEHVEWQSPTSLTSGPVRVKSTTGAPLLASQRVLYKDSFSEIPGVGASRLGTEAVFPWYDLKSPGMRGDWLLIANDSNFEPARVQVSIGGSIMHDPLNPNNDYFIIGPRGRITPQFPGTMGGPVHVICQNCSNGQRLIVSQRVIFNDSFEEVQGVSPLDVGSNWTFPIPVPPEGGTIPPGQSSDTGGGAFFNWYDSQPEHGMKGDWILIGNLGNALAEVSISIGGATMTNPETGNTHFPVAPGGIITPSFANLMDGPVVIGCYNCTDQRLLVSQRVIYKNSFNELVGRP